MLCEREWPLLLVFRRLEVRLDVMVSCCAEWVKDVDLRVALVVSTWDGRVWGMLSAWRDSSIELCDSRNPVLVTFDSRS